MTFIYVTHMNCFKLRKKGYRHETKDGRETAAINFC